LKGVSDIVECLKGMHKEYLDQSVSKILCSSPRQFNSFVPYWLCVLSAIGRLVVSCSDSTHMWSHWSRMSVFGFYIGG